MLQNLGNLALREEADAGESLQNTEFRGIIAYPVTPFKGNGETVDTETLPRPTD